MFAVLGNIPFRPLNSWTSLESKRAYEYAEHKVVEAKPKLQWLSNALEEITFGMMLHSMLGDPAAQLATLQAAAAAHKAMPLVLGNGTHRGYFVITELAETSRKSFADGSALAIELRVTLKEWAKGAEVDPNAPPKPEAAPIGIIVGTLAPGQVVAGTITTGPTGAAVVTFNAPNVGASALTNNPAPGGLPAPNLNFMDVPASTAARAGA